MEFKLVVAGGRDFKDYATLCKFIDHAMSEVVKVNTLAIVCGEARGADALGKRYALERGLTVYSYPANWEKHGKSAGYKRNSEMADVCNGVVAAWDGKSRGTQHMINLAEKLGKQVSILSY